MVLAYDADGNFWKQLRPGIFPPGFHQLLRDLGNSAGLPDLIEDCCGCNGIGGRVTWRFDQRSHKPISPVARQDHPTTCWSGGSGAATAHLSQVWPQQSNLPSAWFRPMPEGQPRGAI